MSFDDSIDPMVDVFIVFLQKVFVHSVDREFVLHDLKYTWEKYAIQLALVHEVLKNDNTVYQVRSVMFDTLMSAHRNEKELEGLSTMIKTVFGAPVPSPRGSSPPRSALRRVMSDASFRVQQFAAICSALRYGCAIEELDFEISLFEVPAEEKQQIWRWIAFGLFHPRSKRFASVSTFHLQKLKFHHTEMDLDDSEAFTRALQSPEELVAVGKDPVPNSPDIVKICVIASGAVIYKDPSETGESVFQTLSEESELETISSKVGWQCVVVPCFGLGWVQSKDVVQVIDGEHSATANLYELVMDWIEAKETKGLTKFIQSAGSKLSSLIMTDCKLSPENAKTIAAIDASCTSLKHLALRDSTLVHGVIKALAKSLRGDLGRHLVSFDLSNNKAKKFPVLDTITEVVAESGRLTHLEELRLDMRPLTLSTLLNLESAFKFNKKLWIVELQDRFPVEYNRYDGAPALGEKRHLFDPEHQGELLGVKAGLTSRQKAAFLSTVIMSPQTDALNSSRARKALDSEMLSRIFKFTGCEVRRHIVWKNPPLGSIQEMLMSGLR